MPEPEELSAVLRGTVTRLGGRSVYALAGELDLDAAESLETRLVQLMDSSGSDVTLDLGDVTFIDSQGLRALVEIQRLAEANSRRFTVENARPPVLRLLQITGLAEMFGAGPAPSGSGD